MMVTRTDGGHGKSRPAPKQDSRLCRGLCLGMLMLLLGGGCEDPAAEIQPCLGACAPSMVCIDGRCLIPDTGLVSDTGVVDAVPVKYSTRSIKKCPIGPRSSCRG